mgnify:CR=1 FL=1
MNTLSALKTTVNIMDTAINTLCAILVAGLKFDRINYSTLPLQSKNNL